MEAGGALGADRDDIWKVSELLSRSPVPKRLCKGTLLREPGHSGRRVSHSRLSVDNMEVSSNAKGLGLAPHRAED